MPNAVGYIADYLNGLTATEKAEVAAAFAQIGFDYPTLLSNYTWRELGMFINFGWRSLDGRRGVEVARWSWGLSLIHI